VPIHRKGTLPWGFLRLIWTLKRNPVDRLFLHGQWAGPVGALAAWLTRVPTIYVTHWPAFYTDWTPWRAFRNAWAEWIPCRLARWVVALTASVQYQYLFRGWVHERKLRIIPNVFSNEKVPESDEILEIHKRLNWTRNQVHVVSVGRLADQKRVDWLLKAWKQVAEKCPQARLWIIGDGPEEVTLRQLAEQLGIRDTCQFLGARPCGIEYIAAGDVTVMTSMYEAFGYVPLEAMACGRPIVASAVDGVRDHITDGVEGRLVLPGNIPCLRDALIELIENSATRQQMGLAGLQRISQFSTAQTINEYLELVTSSPA
jgi:glycosyltransferase involved in cell wall biosynthesis